MMKVKRLLSILLFSILLVFISFRSSAQTINGVINTYAKVIALSSNTVKVDKGNGFVAGDKVLLIQMKGALLKQNNDTTFGDVINYNGAGDYEFNVIASRNGTTITLQNNLCNLFDVNGSTQLVRVPVYTNATVKDSLTCQRWNGSSGGILVFEVSDTLTLNSNITVSGLGFVGGGSKLGVGGYDCINYDWCTSFALLKSGQKGESIADYIKYKDGGRGKWASGGGSSMPSNCGAGGGGNANEGGLGGYSNLYCMGSFNARLNIQGTGGHPYNYTWRKAFMGGGGGGGFADNGGVTPPGTNGGGIIMIRAKVVKGNNYTIRANGIDQTTYTVDEGASGGGAGGCIILRVQNYANAINIEANGGNGGSNYNRTFPSDCHGPGGGGGSGMLLIPQPAMPANVNYTANGGLPGRCKNPLCLCYDSVYHATAGEGTAATSVMFNLPDSVLTPVTPRVNLGNDTLICPNMTIALQLNAGSGYSTYLWQDSSALPVYAANTTGTYYVVVSNTSGCFDRDTLTIALSPPLNIHLGKDTAICAGQPALLSPGAGYSTYLWQDGSANSSFPVNSPGKYYVEVSNSAGCKGADTIKVSDNPLPVVNLGRDTTVCSYATVQLNAGAGFSTYRWQDGSTGATYPATLPGIYSVIATNAFGCADTDDIVVSKYPAVNVSAGNDTSVCPGQLVLLDAGAGFASYVWQNGSTNATFLVKTPGTYFVSVTNNAGCKDADTVNVSNSPLPMVDLGNDISFCPGDSVILNAGSDFSSYLWQNGSSSPQLSASQPGTYSVTVRNSYGCTGTDTLNVLPFLPQPSADLIHDTIFCPSTPFTLQAASGYTAYHWNDNSSLPDLPVLTAGTYSLTVTNAEGCSSSDMAIVTEECESILQLPTAFSPNKDGHNDLFRPLSFYNITRYDMKIYNRWGKLIFESEDVSTGWDGTFKNTECMVGSYVYIVSYSGILKGVTKEGSLKGNVTLLR